MTFIVKVTTVQLLINHVVAWGKSEELELFTLQQKTITLITIATMWRPRSDIGNLQWRYVEFVRNDGNTEPIGVTLKVRQPKEIKPKASKLGALQDKTKCPVHTLWVFCQATLEGRKYLTQDHKLFLKGLQGDSETEWESVATGTIASWLKKIMDSAGIDTEKYTVHSIRAAASIKAVDLGMSFETVKDHANWSQNSSTFENYYYRPRDQHARGREITKKLFGDVTENRTTSGVGVEPTKIVIGTTDNSTVGETETTDVVDTHPWLPQWLYVPSLLSTSRKKI
ncbi:hypothetical protein INT47_012375 [Mucor saturninus]|uniref:Tyr recombinase domain-containing protein n=1 Tax=Mucor saturninus TaxID=64648 RepID=A0A8H7QEA9_9FUNG|nr:hypothetical protein INT47_012375 [Mucor saturninus]